MNTKSIIHLAIAALTLTAGFGSAAQAGELVPIKGTLEGSFTVTMQPGPPPTGTIDLQGTGLAAHLGKFSFEFPHIVNFGAVPPAGAGTFTFTAANGDVLIGDAVGQSSPVEPGVLLVLEEVVITGGTGRFAGASGKLEIVRLIYQSTGTTFGYFDGTISSPGAAKNR